MPSVGINQINFMAREKWGGELNGMPLWLFDKEYPCFVCRLCMYAREFFTVLTMCHTLPLRYMIKLHWAISSLHDYSIVSKSFIFPTKNSMLWAMGTEWTWNGTQTAFSR